MASSLLQRAVQYKLRSIRHKNYAFLFHSNNKETWKMPRVCQNVKTLGCKMVVPTIQLFFPCVTQVNFPN